jgi:hypothetical protein
MESNNEVSRGPGWNKRKADYQDNKDIYGLLMGWTVVLNGKEYRMILNAGNNRFAKKHLIFPGKDDAAKVPQEIRPGREYLQNKATKRLEKRDILADERHAEKFRTEKAAEKGVLIRTNSALNMKPLKVANGAPARHIDQRLAAVKIAEALALKNLKNDELFEMIVDFECQCVVTAYYYSKNSIGTKWGSQMRIAGKAAKILDVNKPGIELFHADTKNL